MPLKAWHATILIVGFAIPMAVAAGRAGRLPAVDIRWPAQELQLPPDTVQDGTEIVLVYIGSSTCVWCQAKELPEWMSQIRTAVAAQADLAGHAFAAVGVSIDFDVPGGLKHLRDLGPFHEVTTGRRWRNIGALKYVSEEHVGRTATPQIVVIRRSVKRFGSPSITRGDVLVRKVGLTDIGAWLARGAPLPTPGRSETGK